MRWSSVFLYTRPRAQSVASIFVTGLDPHTPRYDEHATPRHVPAPFKSKYAFVDNAGFEGDYEVPFVFPTGLPQTTLPTPEAPGQEVTPQDLIPSSYAGRGTGRPTSAGQRPGSESSRRTRPSSARTEPMARYAPPPGYAAQYPVPYAGYPAQPGGYPAVIPGPSAYPRRHHGNRPSSAASSQATPRRSGAAEPGADPTNSFGQARAVFSRAQSQLDKMEHEAKVPDASDGPISVNDLYGHPLKAPSKPESAVRMSRLPPRQKSPRDMNQIDASAMEVAELEAQLLVSRALAKARVTKRM